MNCAEWRERIALDEAAGVEEHLRGCADCREFAAGLRASLELLRAAHAEEIAPAHYTALRARVMAEVRRPRRRAWVWAVVGAAMVLIVAVAAIDRRMRPAPLPRAAAVLPSAPPLPVGSAPSRARSAIAPRRVGRARPVRRLRRNAPAETVLVKLETDNPDVVIYWIAETKGEN